MAANVEIWQISVNGKTDNARVFLATTEAHAIQLWRERQREQRLRVPKDAKVTASRTTGEKVVGRNEGTKELLQRLLDAAEKHGAESEPGMEVGDLQEILRTCWTKMTPPQQRAVYEAHEEIVSEWLG